MGQAGGSAVPVVWGIAFARAGAGGSRDGENGAEARVNRGYRSERSCGGWPGGGRPFVSGRHVLSTGIV